LKECPKVNHVLPKNANTKKTKLYGPKYMAIRGGQLM